MPHFGRMVLELRPVADVDKGIAVRRLVGETGIDAALFGGDDRTDLDAFAALRELRRRGHARARGLRRGRLRRGAGGDPVARPTWSSTGPAGFLDLLRRPLMLFCDLLRVSSLLVAGVATALGAVARRSSPTATPTRSRSRSPVRWWLVGAGAGDLARAPGAGGGGDRRACSQVRGPRPACRPRAPAGSRSCGCGRSAPSRVLVGGAGWVWPQVAAIGAGYAILIALAWRGRERAVAAIEERDGVRFYVEPSSAFEPVQLIRTPGLYRDRAPDRRSHPRRRRSRPARARAPRSRTARTALKSGSRRRAKAIAPPTAAASAASPPSTSPARGPATSESQPTIGPPIGVEPRKTTE